MRGSHREGGARLPEQVRLKPVGQLRRGLEASERSKDSLSLEVEGFMQFQDSLCHHLKTLSL